MGFEICLQALTLLHRENILEPKIYTRTITKLGNCEIQHHHFRYKTSEFKSIKCA